MAICKYGEIITELRGSIGGTTYSRNKAGTYARQKRKPVYPHTVDQVNRAALLSKYSVAWLNVLSDANRINWNDQAAATTWTNPLDQEYSPSGQNLFVRSSVMLQLIGRAHAVNPVDPIDEDPFVFTLDWAECTGIRLTDAGALAAPPNGTVITWASRPQPWSIYKFSGPWILLRVDVIGAQAPPFTIYPCADVQRESRYFFRWRVVRWNARVSFPFFASQDVPVAP